MSKGNASSVPPVFQVLKLVGDEVRRRYPDDLCREHPSGRMMLDLPCGGRLELQPTRSGVGLRIVFPELESNSSHQPDWNTWFAVSDDVVRLAKRITQEIAQLYQFPDREPVMRLSI